MWSVKSQIVKEANPFLFGNENLPLPNATKSRITARPLNMVGEEPDSERGEPFSL